MNQRDVKNVVIKEKQQELTYKKIKKTKMIE